MRIRIKRKKKEANRTVSTDVDEYRLIDPVPIQEAQYKVDLGNITEDKVVSLLKRWRKFLHSLSDDDKKIVHKWACGTSNGCSPEAIDRWSKAIKGSLK